MGERGKLARRALVAWPALAFLKGHRAIADTSEATLQQTLASGPIARQTWVSPPNCYFAYPHNNAFLPNTQLPVIAQRGGEFVTLAAWDFRAGTLRPLARTSVHNMYYDIAEQTGRLFFIDGASRISSVTTSPPPHQDTAANIHLAAPERLEDLLTVNRAGTRLIYALERLASNNPTPAAARFLELDLTTGATSPLCAMPFDADHQQYCPHDESWIGFAHEGDIRHSLDRVWGVHHVGGDGIPHRLWDENSPSGPLLAGHERWAFHRTGALTVAYPSSEGRPRGLYFVDAPSRNATLISASDYDWHCNISRDGRWAVVDTTTGGAPLREPDGRTISDVIAVNMATGQRYFVARSHAAVNHPWHPHPHFTPDGQYVIFNDYQHDGAGKFSRVVVAQLALP